MEVEGRAAGSDFGAILRRHRLAAGLSQEALAERAGMSADGISALERGYRRTPQRETIALLANALALGAQDRLEFESARVPPSGTRHGVRVTVSPWSDGAATTLPLSLTSFVGRDGDLAELATLVREHRLVTVTGAGGVGKTQTALRAAAALGDEIAVRFVGLAPIGDPSQVVAAIASALGAKRVVNRPLLETVGSYLKSRAALLVIDNCEHLISELADVVGKLLSGCPRARILATSREPLNAAGEFAYRLPSLDDSSALVLFTDRARAVDHRFALTDETLPFAAEICRRLDGIPLAIELAAARTNVFPVKLIAEKLADRFGLLTAGERTAPPRQQTMRSLIDWSYDLLSSQERRLFRGVATFIGGWTLEAADSVCDDETLTAFDASDLLSSLAQKSLVVVETREAPRYRLLESMRAFALEKIEQGERELLARRHALWMADLSDRAHDEWKVGSWFRYLSAYKTEFENARCAIDWALAHNETVIAARIVVGFFPVYLFLGADAEGRSRFKAVLERLDGTAHPELMAWVCFDLAIFSLGSAKIEVAKRGVEFGCRCNDPATSALNLALLAQGLIEAGRAAEAQTALDRALPLLKDPRLSGFVTIRARALNELATAARLCGRFDEARYAYHESITLASSVGNEITLVAGRVDLAELEFQMGNPTAALELVRAVEPAALDLPTDLCLIAALGNEAGYLIALGDFTEAHFVARKALQLARGAHPFQVACAMQHLAAAAAALGADPRCSALLRGYAGALLCSGGAVRQTTEQHSDEVLMSLLREKLTTGEIESLAAEGAKLTEEKAVAQALTI